MKTISRRNLLQSLPFFAIAPRFLSQTSKPVVSVKALNYFALEVSDMKRSLDFYQGLFGMPVQLHRDGGVLLRIGNGPQFMSLMPAGSNPPRIVPNVGMSVGNFNADRIVATLLEHGVTKAQASDPGLSGGPMKVRIKMRDRTQEVYLGDPDGLVLQLQDTSFCGGSGPLGNMCLAKPEPSPKQGLMAVKNLSHFTINSSDGNRSNAFYREVFGLPDRSKQGAAVGLGVGPGVMFLMFAGGGGGRGGAPAAPKPASINHVCMNMENFVPDAVMKTLASYGIPQRENPQGPVGPLKSYISLRMENRGGAPGGTPELYFTDPDGLLLQLQDVTYCGGAGFLGNVCVG
ncbi:MAG TPA: VOC family protein [Terriglobia bacterium]|jgi:catechol 2,3-dioxygenase-like lactoylglutathione lyase family enzyme